MELYAGLLLNFKTRNRSPYGLLYQHGNNVNTVYIKNIMSAKLTQAIWK